MKRLFASLSLNFHFYFMLRLAGSSQIKQFLAHFHFIREAIKKSARIKTLPLKEGGDQFENLNIF